MEAGSTRVWRNGRLQEADKADAAVASLCQAIERVVKAHQAETGVRAVILTFDEPVHKETPEPAHKPVPVYVDVFDSGFSQDPGYGHGI